MLTVSSDSGALHTFLASLPCLTAAHGPSYACLSSLRELSILPAPGHAQQQPPNDGLQLPIVIQIALEPALLALGPEHVAVAMNNVAIYYSQVCASPLPPPACLPARGRASSALRLLACQGPRLRPSFPAHAARPADPPTFPPRLPTPRRACPPPQRTLAPVLQREYPSAIDALRLNATYAAVLCEGSVHLHPLPGHDGADGRGRSAVLPEPSGGAARAVSALALTPDFLIYGTKRGAVHYFGLADWAPVSEFRHPEPIVSLWPNALGTRCVFVDAASRAFVLNPVAEAAVGVPALGGGGVAACLWDAAQGGVFVLHDGRAFHTCA